MSESLKNKTVKGVTWSFLDSLLGQGIMFLVGLVLARLLTPEDYGLLAYITILVAVSTSLVDSGFSNALIRKKDAREIDYSTVFITNLVLSLFIVVVLFVSAPAISRFFNAPLLVPLVRVMSVVVVINAFALVQRTALVKKVDFKTQTKASVISSLSSGAVGIGMAFAGFGVWSLVGQQITRQLLLTLCLYLFSRWMPRMRFSWVSFKQMYNFGWKLLVSGLINTVWNEIYQLVIGKFYNASTLGLYTRAQQFASICSSNLNSVVQKVSYPVLSSIQDDKERLKQGYRNIIKVTMLVTFVLMLGMAAVAKPMIVMLIGEKWLPAVPMLQILCFNMMLYPLHSINLNMLQVQGRSDLFLKLEIIKKCIAVGPILLGIFLDIYWMLAGSVLTGWVAYLLNARYSGPFLNYSIKDQVKDIMPGFLVALAMALVVYSMSFLNMSYYLLFFLQLFAGAAITIALCEIANLQEYKEVKTIALSMLRKILGYGKK